jgi:hypothetical protein
MKRTSHIVVFTQSPSLESDIHHSKATTSQTPMLGTCPKEASTSIPIRTRDLKLCLWNRERTSGITIEKSVVCA